MRKSGSVKDVVQLASHIAQLRAEVAVLRDRLEQEENSLASLLEGGKPARNEARSFVSVSERRPVAKGGRTQKGGFVQTPGAERGRTTTRVARVEKGATGRKTAPSGTITDAIVATLERQRSKALSVAEVAAAVRAKPASVATMLQRLVARGLVSKPATGRYRAT